MRCEATGAKKLKLRLDAGSLSTENGSGGADPVPEHNPLLAYPRAVGLDVPGCHRTGCLDTCWRAAGYPFP